MAIDQQDREWIKAIVKVAMEESITASRQVAREIITEALALHQESCPHGKLLSKYKSIAVGICLGSFLAGGGAGAVLAKVFMQ